MIRLIYNGTGEATVTQVLTANESANITERFANIDDACNFIADNLNVADADVDDAVIKMHAHGHSVATFDNGKLQSTSFY